MHLRVGPKFFGLFDASTIGFFRICTQHVESDPELAKRPHAETFRDRAFLCVIAYIFSLGDLKKANVIDWRTIIDFLVNRKGTQQGTLTPKILLEAVHTLSLDSGPAGKELIDRPEIDGIAKYLPEAVEALKAVVAIIPDRPIAPLYCYTSIEKLQALVSTPHLFHWIFEKPAPFRRDVDYVKTFETSIRALETAFVNFFFEQRNPDVPSRATLFGFLKQLPPDTDTMEQFLEEQSKLNLKNYCDEIIKRFKLVLEMPFDEPA
jgi:hypothetical protein